MLCDPFGRCQSAGAPRACGRTPRAGGTAPVHCTVTAASRWSVRPPSVASTRTRYSPGWLKVAVTGQRRSAGSGGVSQPGDQGELLFSR